MLEQPAEQERVHLSAESDPSVDFHNRNAVVKAGAVFRVCVDVDGLYRDPVRLQKLPCVIAQVASFTGIEDGMHIGKGSSVVSR
jgi:hypothetical protein